MEKSSKILRLGYGKKEKDWPIGEIIRKKKEPWAFFAPALVDLPLYAVGRLGAEIAAHA